MLVLSRKVNETIFIGNDVTITVATIDRGKVRLAIHAPPNVRIDRSEIREEILKHGGSNDVQLSGLLPNLQRTSSFRAVPGEHLQAADTGVAGPGGSKPNG